MKKYEILDHPADLKIRAFGKAKEELFLNMVVAMNESMRPEIKRPVEKTKKELRIEAADLAALLVDFLNEVLYLSQTNQEAYNNVKFSQFTDNELAAEIFGQKVERFGEEIKAVTYHSLEVKKVGDHWEAVVLFDI